ncbi:hypothetical protein [Alloyangia pacifica]|nr:hypothetical protein [Alloyangia pacifica]
MKQHPIGLYRQEYADIIGAEFAVLLVAVSAQTHLGCLSEPARRFPQG